VVVFVKLPEIPVIVTVTVPVVAVPLALSVKVLLLAVLVGLNDAVTPEGRPDADKLTLRLKPFTGATVMVLVFAPPCTMLKPLGDAESVKFGTGAGLTVRKIVAVVRCEPEVPVTVTGKVPIAAEMPAVRVKVLLLEVVLGLKDALTPLGRPEAVKLTLPLKPFSKVTVILLAPLVPCTSATLVGDADSTNPGRVGDPGQLLTRLAAFTVPMPVAKSQPVAVP
jgi:hypothetical protein